LWWGHVLKLYLAELISFLLQKFTIVSMIQLDITLLNHRKGMKCLHNNFLFLKVFGKSGNS
jgi:hypothetical protein